MDGYVHGAYHHAQGQSSMPYNAYQPSFSAYTSPPQPVVPSSQPWPHPNDHYLTVTQQPIHVKVTANKEKDRKCIDPPPAVKLVVNPAKDVFGHYKHSPYYFVTVQLIGATDDDEDPGPNSLVGGVSASGHNVKDQENEHNMYFVFADVSVKKEGKFRLRFSLHKLELDKNECLELAEAVSEPFESCPARTFPGLLESTSFTRMLGDQGVRLRIRKDSRAIKTQKRNRDVAERCKELAEQMVANGERPDKRSRLSRDGPARFSPRERLSDYSPGRARLTRQSFASTSSRVPMTTSMATPFRGNVLSSLTTNPDHGFQEFHTGFRSATSSFSPVGQRESPSRTASAQAYSSSVLHSPLPGQQNSYSNGFTNDYTNSYPSSNQNGNQNGYQNDVFNDSPHTSHSSYSYAYGGTAPPSQEADINSTAVTSMHSQQTMYGHQQAGHISPQVGSNNGQQTMYGNHQTSPAGSSPDHNNYTTAPTGFGTPGSYLPVSGNGSRINLSYRGRWQGGGPVLPHPVDAMNNNVSHGQ